MRVLANKINAGSIHIDLWRLNRTYKKYLNKRNRAIFELYQLGVLDSPVYINMRMIKRYLVEEFKPVMKYLVSGVDGKFLLERRQFKLASEIYTDDETFNDIAKALNDYYESQYILEELSKVRSKIKLRMTGCDISPRVAVSTSAVSIRCRIDFCNKGVQECITLPEGKELEYLDFSDLILTGIAKFIGISDEIIEEYKKNNKSLFVGNITYEEERKYIDILLTGQVVLDGDFGDKLKSKIIDYYCVNFNDTDNNIGYEKFEEVVYRSCFDAREEFIQEKVAEDFTPFIMNDFGVYYLVDSDKKEGNEDVYNMDTDVVYGNYCMNNTTGLQFSEIERLKGVCGEYISEKEAQKKGYKFTTLPIEIDGKNYFCLTDIDDEDKPEPFIGNKAFFEFKDLKDMLRKLYLPDIKTFKGFLRQQYKRMVVSNYTDFEMNMTCEIALRYILADWGYNYRPPIENKFVEVSTRTLEKFMESAENLVNGLNF